MSKHSFNHKGYLNWQSKMKAERKPIVSECTSDTERCIRCEEETGLCSVYINPEARWNIGVCPMASHVNTKEKEKKKVRVGQQKQKRRNR